MMTHGVATPLAAVLGAAERAAGFTAKDEGVFFGEALAGIAGFHMAIPTAFITAARAAKAGLKVPLEAERTLVDLAVARGEKPPMAVARSVENSEIPQARPIEGKLGRVIGFPGDMAGAIHGFFKIMGYDGSIAAQAYRQAVKEGLHPLSDGFFDRVDYWRKNPTESMMQKGIDDAYTGTFMQDLGEKGKAFNEFVKKTPVMRWVFPFRHIPINLLKATYEWSPLAFFDKEMRANLMGENGPEARQLATSKMIIGSAVMGHFFNLYMNGQATGEYPNDPKEQEVWRLTGKQPNSVLINGEWWSMERLGPAGQLAMLGANLGRVVEGLESEQDDAMVIATTRLAEAAGHFVSDAPGFLTLQNYFDSRNDPKKWTRFIASEAGTLLPYSSTVKQAASFTDPYMREAKTFLDGIKYSIPGLRQSLLPRRRWDGQPVENPGYDSVIRAGHAITDPVDQELARLGIHAAPPQDRIGGVKLSPQLYDQYQATAGPFARAALNAVVSNPNWSKTPDYQRAQVMRAIITATRKRAEAAMMMAHPELIQAAVQAKVNRILGQPAPALQQ